MLAQPRPRLIPIERRRLRDAQRIGWFVHHQRRQKNRPAGVETETLIVRLPRAG